MNLFKTLLIIISSIVLSSCSKSTIYYSSSAYRPFETQIVNKSTDGLVTLKVFGSGLNIDEAIEQAMKTAVHDITFKGIAVGTGSNNVPALIREVNAREKHRYYFDEFFSSNGLYQSFVERMIPKNKIKGYGTDELVNVSVLIKVDMSALQQQYIRDGIIRH